MCRGCEPWEEITRTHYANVGTYHYTIVACKFVKAGRVGLTLVTGSIFLVASVEDLKIVAISIVTDEDIGEEFQDCGFADTSLSNQKDSVIRFNLVLRRPDDPLLERLYVTRNTVRGHAPKTL